MANGDEYHAAGVTIVLRSSLVAASACIVRVRGSDFVWNWNQSPQATRRNPDRIITSYRIIK